MLTFHQTLTARTIVPLAVLALLAVGLLLAGCSSDAPPQAQPQQQAQPQAQPQQQAQPQAAQTEQTEQATGRSLEGVPGIVDPSNSGWPREVEGVNGIVSIPAKPLRIITASIGHDELTLALVPNERLIAVGAVSKDANYSNIADLVQDKVEISRDPELLIAQSPDVIVTSAFFPIETVEALQRVGIPVIQTALAPSQEDRINSVLLMGYIYGEEARAFAFADELEARYNDVTAVAAAQPAQPLVLALTQYTEDIWTAGSDSTAGGVITAAGGVNAAALAGIAGNQTTDLEGVIAMAPEVIIIAQPPQFGGEDFRQLLLNNEALAELPAIQRGAVYLVESKFFTTLSHWNLRGVEQLARLLWPDQFPQPAPAAFSLPE